MIWSTFGRRWAALPGASAAFALIQSFVTALIREKLTANRTYYVRTDGSDSNTGLVDSAGGAFLTIQKAIDVVFETLDLGGFDVTIDVGNGTYTGAVSATSPQVGAGTITISGDTTTPSNVVLSVADSCITVSGGTKLSVQGLKLQNTAGWACINADADGFVTITGKMEFGASTSQRHISATAGGKVFAVGIEEITSGSAVAHYSVASGGYIQILFPTWTLSGTPAFSTAFAHSESAGVMLIPASAGTTGTATGKRYNVVTNGVVNTGGGGASYFPGNAAGTTATGGQYA